MRRKKQKLSSRAFSTLLEFADSLPETSAGYDYSFIDELASDHLEKTNLQLSLQELERVQVPYATARKCMFYLQNKRVREVKRLSKRSPAHVLLISKALFSHPIIKWRSILMALFKSVLSSIEDRKDEIKIAVRSALLVETNLGLQVREHLTACVLANCSVLNIIKAIKSLFSSKKYTKYLSGFLSRIYAFPIGQQFYLSLLEEQTEVHMLLYLHTTHALFTAGIFHAFNSTTALGVHIESLLLSDQWMHSRSKGEEHTGSAENTENFLKRKISRVYLSMLHFLEVAFRRSWLSRVQITKFAALLFRVFEKTEDIRVLRTLSCSISFLERKQACMYSRAGVCSISYILNKKKEINKHTLESILCILHNTITPENSQLLGASGMLKLFEKMGSHDRKLVLITGVVCQNLRIFSELFEKIESGSPFCSIIIQALFIAKIQIPDSMLSRYLVVIQKKNSLTWECLGKYSEYLPNLLPETKQKSISQCLFLWASELLPTSEECTYLLGLITGFCKYLSDCAALERIFVLLFKETNNNISTSGLYDAIYAVFSRIMVLNRLFVHSTAFSEAVFSLPTKIELADAHSLPGLYDLVLKMHVYSCGWKEWENTVFALVDRIPIYVPAKNTRESLLIGTMCTASILDKVLRSIDRYIQNGKTARFTVKVLAMLCIEGHQAQKVFRYLQAKYEVFTLEKKPLALKLLRCIVDKYSERRESCRELCSIFLLSLENALKIESFPLQKSALLTVLSLIKNCGGAFLDYKMAVHLLNCAFPLLLVEKLEKYVFSVLETCAQRLTIEFVVYYIMPGLSHPDKRVRNVHRRAYAHLVNTGSTLLWSQNSLEISSYLYSQTYTKK